MKKYTFTTTSKFKFEVSPGGFLALRAVLFERGDENTPVEHRPDMRYEEGQVPTLEDTGQDGSIGQDQVSCHVIPTSE